MSEQWTIKIDTGNSAFDDMPGQEIAMILRNLADYFARGGIPPFKLYDSNGNHCGNVSKTWGEE